MSITQYLAMLVALSRINPRLYLAVRTYINMLIYRSGRVPNFTRAGQAAGLSPALVNTYLAIAQGDIQRALIYNGYGALTRLTSTSADLNTLLRLSGQPTLPTLPGGGGLGAFGQLPAASSSTLNPLLGLFGLRVPSLG